MTPLRAAIELLIMLILFVAMIVIIPLFILNAHAEDYLSGQLTVDFAKEEAKYTESHSFGMQMTASVPENSCNRCLRDNSSSACLDVCEDVMLTY